MPASRVSSGRLKVEAIHGELFFTRDFIRQAAFESIETECNTVKLHSANGFESPIQFEANSKQILVS